MRTRAIPPQAAAGSFFLLGRASPFTPFDKHWRAGWCSRYRAKRRTPAIAACQRCGGSDRAMGLSELLNVLRLHPVEPGKVAVSRFKLLQEVIEFRVDRLRVSMLRALDKHGHHPCCKGGGS